MNKFRKYLLKRKLKKELKDYAKLMIKMKYNKNCPESPYFDPVHKIEKKVINGIDYYGMVQRTQEELDALYRKTKKQKKKEFREAQAELERIDKWSKEDIERELQAGSLEDDKKSKTIRNEGKRKGLKSS